MGFFTFLINTRWWFMLAAMAGFALFAHNPKIILIDGREFLPYHVIFLFIGATTSFILGSIGFSCKESRHDRKIKQAEQRVAALFDGLSTDVRAVLPYLLCRYLYEVLKGVFDEATLQLASGATLTVQKPTHPDHALAVLKFSSKNPAFVVRAHVLGHTSENGYDLNWRCVDFVDPKTAAVDEVAANAAVAQLKLDLSVLAGQQHRAAPPQQDPRAHRPPRAAPGPAPAMPVFVVALNGLSRHVDALRALDPALGFSGCADRLTAAVARFLAFAQTRVLTGTTFDFVADHLVPRLSQTLAALPALQHAGDLAPLRAALDGMVGHLSKSADVFDADFLRATTQEAARALHVADLTMPGTKLSFLRETTTA